LTSKLPSMILCVCNWLKMWLNMFSCDFVTAS
jgi:hypothetical protein